MRRSLTWILAATSLGASAAACNLVANLGQFDSARALSADSATPPMDAQAPPRDTSVLPDAASPLDGQSDADADADADAGHSDAGDASDAGADAGRVEAGPPPRWCITNITPTTSFCRDFDDGMSYTIGWSNAYAIPYDFAKLDSDYAPGSAPNSLILTTPLLKAGAPAAQELFTENTTFHALIDLKFALKIVNFDPTATDVSLVRVSYQNGAWWISLDLSGSSSQLLETLAATPDAGQIYVSHSVPLPPLGVWVNVDLLVDTRANTASLSYDGVIVLPPTPTVNPPQSLAAFATTVGINYLQAPAQPMQIRYDNILINTP